AMDACSPGLRWACRCGIVGLPAADRLPTTPRLRRYSLVSDEFAARANHPGTVLGADLPPGAPPLSIGPQPSLAGTIPASRPLVQTSGRADEARAIGEPPPIFSCPPPCHSGIVASDALVSLGVEKRSRKAVGQRGHIPLGLLVATGEVLPMKKIHVNVG